MRLFERLRGKFRYEPTAIDAVPQPSLNQATAAATSLVLESTEGICCGHCSGKAEGHSAEKSAAQNADEHSGPTPLLSRAFAHL